MTTVLRPYINYEYIQKVDDGCLEYKSIPMAVVNNLIKIQHFKNDFTGIKQVYNMIPPRPKDLNTMATSIARINNLSYSDAVPRINKNFIQEEVSAVRAFVASGPGFLAPQIIPQYVGQGNSQRPVMSSSGERLVPDVNVSQGAPHRFSRAIEEVSYILGNFDETSGVVPLNPSMEAQTEWQGRRNQLVMNREGEAIPRLFEYGEKTKGEFGITKTFGQIFPAGSGVIVSGYRKGEMGSFREGIEAQSRLTKPSTKSGYMTAEAGVYETYIGTPGSTVQYVTKEKHTFLIDPQNSQGTFQGTPDRHRNRGDRIKGVQQMMGEPYTKRGGLESAGHSDFPSGGETPVGPLDRGRQIERTKSGGNRSSRGDTPGPSMRN